MGGIIYQKSVRVYSGLWLLARCMVYLSNMSYFEAFTSEHLFDNHEIVVRYLSNLFHLPFDLRGKKTSKCQFSKSSCQELWKVKLFYCYVLTIRGAALTQCWNKSNSHSSSSSNSSSSSSKQHLYKKSQVWEVMNAADSLLPTFISISLSHTNFLMSFSTSSIVKFTLLSYYLGKEILLCINSRHIKRYRLFGQISKFGRLLKALSDHLNGPAHFEVIEGAC